MFEDVTFASLLTPAGVVVAGGIISTLVSILKSVLPALADRINGLQQSSIIAAVLFVIVAVVVPQTGADSYLGVFLAWLATEATAVATYEVVTKNVTSGNTKSSGNSVIGKNEKFDDE